MNRETRKFVRRMNSHRLASATAATRIATISPARTPGVCSALMTSRMAATKRTVRHASPNSNLRLKSMFLHAPVERSAAEPKLRCGKRNVEMVHAQRALDHLLFELVEVQGIARVGGDRTLLPASRQREIVASIMFALGHDHRPLRRMPERANVARPVMGDERLE